MFLKITIFGGTLPHLKRVGIWLRYGHKNMRIRTKPFRPDLKAPKDKNKKGLDDP